MKKLILIIACFICFSTAFSQIQPLTGNELPGLQLADTDTYDTRSLWDFYNDNASRIAEYGFTKLLVQKFIINDQNFKLEAYFMNTPEAAYGLYSINVLKCQKLDSLTSFDCLTQVQYQAAFGRFYIVIKNETGTPTAQQTSYALAGKFMLLNPQTPMQLPSVFNAPRFDGNRDQIDYICGMQGMQNSLIPWQNMIIGIRFAMYAVILPDPRGEIYFAQITFPFQADMFNFLTNANLMQNGVPVQAYDPNTFVFREFVPVEGFTIYFLQCIQPVAIAEVTAE
ncbi:MAG: DUF6599 family protein [bacterium]